MMGGLDAPTEYIKEVIRLLGIRDKLTEMPNNLSGAGGKTGDPAV